jgi:hypothetical protein
MNMYLVVLISLGSSLIGNAIGLYFGARRERKKHSCCVHGMKADSKVGMCRKHMQMDLLDKNWVPTAFELYMFTKKFWEPSEEKIEAATKTEDGVADRYRNVLLDILARAHDENELAIDSLARSADMINNVLGLEGPCNCSSCRQYEREAGRK